MKKNLPIILSSLVITMASCSRHHTPTVQEQKTAGHKMIAVLPAEMIYSGIPPKNITEEDLLKNEEAESKTFQQFYTIIYCEMAIQTNIH